MKKETQPIRNPKIVRAYVPGESDRRRMAELTGLKIEHVKVAPNVPPKMRAGELLAVFDLTVFGETRKVIAEAVDAVQENGADIIEIETGMVCGKGVAVLNRALGIIHGRSRQGQAQKDGQKKSVAIRTAGRKVDRAGLYDLWGSDLTLQQIIEQSGWKQSSIYHAMKGVSREDAKANVQARLRRTRKVRTK